MAGIVGQVGCITVLFIGIAFAAGFYIDNFLDLERRIFTILFLVGSVPVALYVIARISLRTMARVQAQLEQTEAEDQSES